MTTELTKAAQQALKPHQIAQLVNKLRDIATKYHAHGCLRELISREVNAALTQRPAAQSEREADATERAFVLATMAAEEFVRCNGLATGEADEFLMTGPDLTDEYATACIDHLKWVGECVAFDCDDGVVVRLGDFTLGSLA